MNNGDKKELYKRIKAMRHLMDQHFIKEQSLTNQKMLELSQVMDKLILEFLMTAHPAQDQSNEYPLHSEPGTIIELHSECVRSVAPHVAHSVVNHKPI